MHQHTAAATEIACRFCVFAIFEHLLMRISTYTPLDVTSNVLKFQTLPGRRTTCADSSHDDHAALGEVVLQWSALPTDHHRYTSVREDAKWRLCPFLQWRRTFSRGEGGGTSTGSTFPACHGV